MNHIIWSAEILDKIRNRLCLSNNLAILPSPESDGLWFCDVKLQIWPEPQFEQGSGRIRWDLNVSTAAVNLYSFLG